MGNFATVFNDQAYWQRAIASRPASCVKAYLLGGIAWFAIPFSFATTMGLAAVALRGDEAMRVLSPADVSAGLPAPSAAAALLGKSGAAAVLVLLFLAVTSATSAELIAVSSILTYDVYVVSSVPFLFYHYFSLVLIYAHFFCRRHCRSATSTRTQQKNKSHASHIGWLH